MGNVASDAEFIAQYRYLVREKFRITRPGRLTALHVKDLVYYQNASDDGSSGLRLFSDQCTAAPGRRLTFTAASPSSATRYWSAQNQCAWPAVEDLQKDASFCRVGMPEYLLVFRKWAKEGQEDLVPASGTPCRPRAA